MNIRRDDFHRQPFTAGHVCSPAKLWFGLLDIKLKSAEVQTILRLLQ